MTTAPATEPTPSGDPAAQAGNTPSTPLPPLTPTQRKLIAGVGIGTTAIAGIGFAGSYHTVTALGEEKGFGELAGAITLGVDIGIGVFLALDLLLTWLRIPFPLLRYGAWLLTTATISFNASSSWPDPVGVGMHAVIPLLFVIAIEAARHAVGRGADIVADKHIEYPPFSRWLTHPIDQAIIVRRQRGWNVRDYRDVIRHRKEVRIYKARLRKDHGKKWRRTAPADKLLVLQLAHYGMTIAEAIEMPEAEARKAAEAKRKAEAAEAEAKHRAELAEAEAEAKRRTEVAEAEAAEAEAKSRIETAKAEAEAKLRIEAARAAEVEAEVKRKSEAEAARLLREASEAEAEAKLRIESARREEAHKARLAEAEAEAKVSALALQQRQASEQAAAQQRQRQWVEQQRIAEEQRRAASARAEEDRRRREQQKAEQARAEVNRLREQAASTSASPSGSTSGSAAKAASVSAANATPKATVSASVSDAANLGGRRSKRQAEVDEVLARIVQSRDPKSVSLEWVMEHFDLKQTTAYDRLATAQKLWAEGNAA
uniref:DUF2637 domain-containing protein n=1 Tax=Streptomyces tubercidicus TaxID=47759 RepID=UPI0030E0CDF6